MADGTSVGKVFLDIEISPKSINTELGKLSSVFNSAFKSMFSRTMGQTSNFAKDTMNMISGSFKKIGQVGTASSDKVAKSIEGMNKEYQKTQEEIQKIQNELAALDTQRDSIIQKYASMPPLTGMTKDETLEQLLKSDQGFARLGARVEELEMKMTPLKNRSSELADAIRQIGTETDKAGLKTNRMTSFIKSAMKQILKFSLIKRIFTRETQKATGATAKFGGTMKRVAGMLARRLIVYQLLGRGIMNLIRYLWSALKTNQQFAKSLNIIKTNLLVAFQPIYDFIIPALNALMQALATITTYIATAMSALFGKTYQQSFNSAQKMNKAIEGMGKSAKKAGKDAKGALAPFDEINQLMTGTDDADAGGGDGGFEMEMPDLATVDMTGIEKFKEIMADLFKPFKLAWEVEGQNTIDAARGTLESIKGLIGAIAKSWREVWTGGSGQQIIENVLKITQNILKTAGNLADAFRKAWEQNEIGTKIIQGIFDISNSILGTIVKITEATAEWAKNLNFTPRLEAAKILLDAIKPLIENLGKLLAWLWENVLLPFVGWVIEDFVPVFLDVLAGAISVLNSVLEVFAPLGQWLWAEFLQPLAEWTGGVIVSVLESIGIGLNAISDWITGHQALIETLAIIVGSFAAAWGLVNIAIGVWNGIAVIATGVTTAFGAAVAFLTSPVTIAIAIIGGLIAIGILLYKNWEEISAWLKKIWEAIKDAATKIWNSVKDFFVKTWDSIKAKITEKWDAIKKFFSDTWNSIKNTITNVWDSIKTWLFDKFDAIYTKASDVFTKMKNFIKGITDSIGGFFKGMVNGVIKALNFMIGGLNKLSFDVPDWVPLMGGNSFGFNIPKIPLLGKGAIVDQPTLAMVGERGREAVIPLENNTGWIKQLAVDLSEIIDGGGGDTTVIVKIGEDIIIDKVISGVNRQSRISGKTVITV